MKRGDAQKEAGKDECGKPWNRNGGVCPGGNEARQGDDGRLRINLTSDSWRLQERLGGAPYITFITAVLIFISHKTSGALLFSSVDELDIRIIHDLTHVAKLSAPPFLLLPLSRVDATRRSRFNGNSCSHRSSSSHFAWPGRPIPPRFYSQLYPNFSP